MKLLLSIILVATFHLTANSITNASEVSKKIWSEALVNTIPQTECKAGGFFQSCYSWTDSMCKAEITKIVKSCISKIEKDVPDSMELPGKDQKWTDLTTSCLYQEVKNKYKKYLLEDQHCIEGLNLLK